MSNTALHERLRLASSPLIPAFAIRSLKRDANVGIGPRDRRHFSDDATLPKTLLSELPNPLTATMIARLMPAAISPYSIAVAPLSSAQKAESKRFTSPS